MKNRAMDSRKNADQVVIDLDVVDAAHGLPRGTTAWQVNEWSDKDLPPGKKRVLTRVGYVKLCELEGMEPCPIVLTAFDNPSLARMASGGGRPDLR